MRLFIITLTLLFSLNTLAFGCEIEIPTQIRENGIVEGGCIPDRKPIFPAPKKKVTKDKTAQAAPAKPSSAAPAKTTQNAQVSSPKERLGRLQDQLWWTGLVFGLVGALTILSVFTLIVKGAFLY